jgi:biotin carboxyl carrier protein
VARVRYYVSLDPHAEPILVDVEELPTGALDVKVGGERADVDVVPVGGQLSIRIDGRVIDLTTDGMPPDVGVTASGLRTFARVESDRQRAADAARKSRIGGTDKILKSPMPGRVVKVLVAPGDTVSAGAALLVIEAMKMENEVRAKADGKVVGVHVKVGETVEGNARLVTLG